MATKKQYTQAKKDYNYLTKTHGEPSDLTGGFVLDDYIFKLLETPTHTKAYRIYVDLIRYGFQNTLDDCDIKWHVDDNRGNTISKSVMDDLKTIKIYNRYH